MGRLDVSPHVLNDDVTAFIPHTFLPKHYLLGPA